MTKLFLILLILCSSTDIVSATSSSKDAFKFTELVLEEPILDPISLAKNVDATFLIEGAGNWIDKLILLDGGVITDNLTSVSSKCDFASTNRIKNLSGKGKKILKNYKSAKSFARRHKPESLWIAAKIKILENDINFFCVLSSKTNSLYAPLMPNSESQYLEKFNIANKETETKLQETQFKSHFNNSKISEFKFREEPKSLPIKGKFETSEEFARRVGTFPPIKLNYFKYGEISQKTVDYPDYDADTQTAIFFRLGDWHMPYEKEYNPGISEANILLEADTSSRSYQGSNAFGVSKWVSLESGKKTFVRIPFPYPFWRSSLPYYFSDNQRVKIPIELAKENLEAMAYSIEVSIESPSTLYNHDYRPPDLDYSSGRDIKYYTYRGKVISVQVGNTETGELYFSHNPVDQKNPFELLRDPRSCKYNDRGRTVTGWTGPTPSLIRKRKIDEYYLHSETARDLCYKYFLLESGILVPFDVVSLLPPGSSIYETNSEYFFMAYRFEPL